MSFENEAHPELTILLDQARSGDGEALEELVITVYQDLRRTAKHLVSREPESLTLSTTDVVHEAFFKLFGPDTSWENRWHFFSTAATAMRRVLIDHARRKNAKKRQRAEDIVELELSGEDQDERQYDLIALDDALNRLAETNPRQAKIVELKYFAGLKDTEIAELLKVSRMTVHRDWKVARLRLKRELKK